MTLFFNALNPAAMPGFFVKKNPIKLLCRKNLWFIFLRNAEFYEELNNINAKMVQEKQ